MESQEATGEVPLEALQTEFSHHGDSVNRSDRGVWIFKRVSGWLQSKAGFCATHHHSTRLKWVYLTHFF